MSYAEFLRQKTDHGVKHGFEPLYMPSFLFDFQEALVDWAVRLGRAGIFADCGMGKTPMQLVWAENVIRKTNRPVLILTPLAVTGQTLDEAEKFDIEAHRADIRQNPMTVQVTNYEKLHYFGAANYAGVVCDESSILKNFDGKRKAAITEFMRRIPYRLLCTATAAPNDWIELGTSSEALGYLGHTDMLTRFFTSRNNTVALQRGRFARDKFRLKGHAEEPFWRWVASWARAARKPSDLGFDDDGFILPPLEETHTLVKATMPTPGALFDLPAVSFREEREAVRRTIHERCAAVAEKVKGHKISMVWCHLNDESDLLEQLIPNCIQIGGRHSEEYREIAVEWFKGKRCICNESMFRGKLRAWKNSNETTQDTCDNTTCMCGYASGIRRLVSKPKVMAFGLNFQHCAHMTYFPTHSYEQYYQATRRLWRFGQTQPVTVDLIYTDGGSRMMENLARKAKGADRMFADLVRYMDQSMTIEETYEQSKGEVPAWMTTK